MMIVQKGAEIGDHEGDQGRLLEELKSHGRRFVERLKNCLLVLSIGRFGLLYDAPATLKCMA
jgi:hypothetical protein